MTAPHVDTGYAPARWAFDDEVTAAFDDMLRRSIPQYDVMRASVFELACRYVKPATAIVDLGCSRGEALAPFIDRFGAANRYVGLEISEPMLAACRERFRGLIDCSMVDIRKADLRLGFAPVKASVVLSVLTLQFVPIEHRQELPRAIFRSVEPGGAFLVVEKVLGAGAELDAAFVAAYYAGKRANGYSADDVERKRLALEGVLVPITAGWNVELLRSAGFDRVDCFWRWMNFAGWIALKPDR
jgi:tRNA (cmo5U34)-methyltransferase